MKKLITHNESICRLPLRWKSSGWLELREDQFFLSFADAYRGVVGQLNSAEHTILVPDFYCPETLGLYKAYGTLKFYRTNNDLTINVPSYIAAIKKYRPQVIINYGFLSSPFRDEAVESLLRKLPDVIIIEDCAHKILQEKDLVFAHDNHFYIDSIRKQTALLGSHLFDESRILKARHFERVNWYKTRSTLLKTAQEMMNIATLLLQSKVFYRQSEACFEALDNLIGTYPEPTLGGWVSHCMWNRLDFKKILSHKKQLIDKYLLSLGNIKHKYFLLPPINDENISYFPCVVSPIIRSQLIEYLEAENIFIDSLWDLPRDPLSGLNQSLFESVLVLPLTWEITSREAEKVGRKIQLFFYDNPTVKTV